MATMEGDRGDRFGGRTLPTVLTFRRFNKMDRDREALKDGSRPDESGVIDPSQLNVARIIIDSARRKPPVPGESPSRSGPAAA
jgi:hypothetical protein